MEKTDKPTVKPAPAVKESEDFRHIVRVVNTDLDGGRKVIDSIRKIKGIGFAFANALCSSAGVDRLKRTGDLTDIELKRLEETIAKAPSLFPQWLLNRRKNLEDSSSQHLVTTDLSFAQENDIRLLKRIRCYRGIRHIAGAPVRGQRTRSNFRKNKGKVLGVVKVKQTGTSGK